MNKKWFDRVKTIPFFLWFIPFALPIWIINIVGYWACGVEDAGQQYGDWCVQQWNED